MTSEAMGSAGQAIHRGLTREALDAQLNLRARWPEHREHFQAWAEDSRKARERLKGYVELAYGSSSGERLDLFPVAGNPDAPLLVFIHGGYWQSLDKGDFSYLAPAFAEAGIAYASINYDLAPKVSIPTMVQQVRRALAWLGANGRQYGVDVSRLAVAGHSAGGHLASLAVEPEWMAAAGFAPDSIRGAISISGVYDLEPIRLSFHQAVLRLTLEDAQAWSPLRAGLRSRAPLVLTVGEEETEEFLLQQDEFAAAMRTLGRPVQVVDMPARQHFSALDALGEADHALHHAVRALFED